MRQLCIGEIVRKFAKYFNMTLHIIISGENEGKRGRDIRVENEARRDEEEGEQQK